MYPHHNIHPSFPIIAFSSHLYETNWLEEKILEKNHLQKRIWEGKISICTSEIKVDDMSLDQVSYGRGDMRPRESPDLGPPLRPTFKTHTQILFQSDTVFILDLTLQWSPYSRPKCLNYALLRLVCTDEIAKGSLHKEEGRKSSGWVMGSPPWRSTRFGLLHSMKRYRVGQRRWKHFKMQ